MHRAGEGPDKEMLLGLIDELGIGAHATICDFTKARCARDAPEVTPSCALTGASG